MKTYTGYKIDENDNFCGISKFIVFGEMSDRTKCYHEIKNGQEIQKNWFSCFIVNGKKIFKLMGE